MAAALEASSTPLIRWAFNFSLMWPSFNFCNLTTQFLCSWMGSWKITSTQYSVGFRSWFQGLKSNKFQYKTPNCTFKSNPNPFEIQIWSVWASKTSFRDWEDHPQYPLHQDSYAAAGRVWCGKSFLDARGIRKHTIFSTASGALGVVPFSDIYTTTKIRR